MIDNLSQLKDEFNKCRGIWAWVGQRGIDAFTVTDFVSVDAVFCCDFGEKYSELWEEGSLFSVEKELGRRENWGNRDLEMLWEGSMRKRIEKFVDRMNAPINTVSYRSLAVLERDRRFRVLSPPLALKDLFDDKLRQLEVFSALGVNTPATHICRLNETTFSKAGDVLDGPFVVQPPVGSSGENTYFVNNEDDFEAVRDVFGPAQLLKLSKYMPLPSLNGHCVVLKTKDGLRSIAACPSVQVVGARGCTNRPEIYCGNDFSSAENVSETLREKACSIMEAVGLFMGEKGFLGIFGMDFLLGSDEVLALEINPRFQGSTMLLSMIQADRGEIPSAALHVMQFMGLAEAFSLKFLEQLKKRYRIPYKGAHLIVHSLADEVYRIKHDLMAGVHTLREGAIERVRDGTTYREVKHPGEWCILGNLPLQATEIHPEARFAMIQTNERILDSNLQQLEPYAETFVNRLQNRCIRLPFNGGSE